MSFDSNTIETKTPTTECYRLGPQYLVLGIVCLAFFLAMDVGSVYVAYWNIDGSFGRPELAAVVFGVFWSLWVLLSLWLIIAYFRERLFVSADAITQHGCIRKRTINFPDVIKIVWKRIPKGGSVIIRGHFSRIKIYLSNFTSDEQDRLITLLRGEFAPEIQEGWERFNESRLLVVAARTPTKSRGTAMICALLLFSFAGIFGYCWASGLGIQWLIVGILNALFGMWYLWRIFKWRDESSSEELA